MANIVLQGSNVIAAHLEHLKSHNQTEFHKQALDFLKSQNIPILDSQKQHSDHHAGCPGAAFRSIRRNGTVVEPNEISPQRSSQLTHWPVQLHLMSPQAPVYKGADVVLSADCVGYAYGDFHKDWLKRKALAIACPKLDDGQNEYVKKITELIDNAQINTLTVITMEVPCCKGLLAIAMQGVSKASRKIPIKSVVIGIDGQKRSEERL
jgi:hypothetical protein